MLNRRSFLRIAGLVGAGAVVPGCAFRAAPEIARFDRTLVKVSKTRLGMGSSVSMILLHPSADQAEAAMAAGFDEVDRLSRLLSRFDSSSPVSFLNDNGRLDDLAPELREVLARSLHYHRLTRGAFDITVKPLLDLFTDRGERRLVPREAEIAALLPRIDSRRVALSGRSVFFAGEGMGVTLDGIAVGYVVDRAAAVVAGCGIGNFLIDAGGEIRAAGAKEAGRPWTVAIRDPGNGAGYPDVVRLCNAAISTSGNYEIFYDSERVFHHIVDPATGRSPRADASVSVTARTALEADALSTGVFVMDPAAGTAFVDGLSGCESLIIDRGGRKWESRGWRAGSVA